MPNYLVPTTDMIPTFDERTGKEIGRIKINEPILIKSSDATRHYFDFGAGVAYAMKSQTKVVTSSVPATGSDYRATTLPSKDDYICTDVIDKTIIYDYSRNHPIGTIAKGYQIPLIGGNSEGWYAIKIGNRISKVRVKDVRLSKGVPVLCYHRIIKKAERTSAADGTFEYFVDQLDYLVSEGYETITLTELEMYLKKQLNLPVKTVAITFDDGNKTSFRYAYPELKKRGMKATEFFITKRLRDIPVEPWDPSFNQILVVSEMRQMTDVFKFENHTHDKHFIVNEGTPQQTSAMGNSTLAEIESDLQANAGALQSFGFEPSKYLAYPFGNTDGQAVQGAKSSGVVNMAFTTSTESHALVSGDIYKVPRHQISPYHEGSTGTNSGFKRAVDVS